VISIDILYLVDRFETVLNAGQRVPFTNKIMVDERECLDIVDQMRIVVPEEIKQARRVSQDRDRITGQAQEEAERVLARAQEQADRMMDEQGLLDRAHVREREIIEEAEARAEQMRADAEQYVLDILEDLNRRLGGVVNQVQGGIDALRPRVPVVARSQGVAVRDELEER
jgi:cell division septum initiation protein DivIVA